MDRSLPEHNDVRSKVEAVMPGVPGGTILGPLLFILYINDLSVQVHWATRCHLFVDDYLLFWVINPTQDQTQLQDPQRINPPTLPTKSLASFLTGCPYELKRWLILHLYIPVLSMHVYCEIPFSPRTDITSRRPSGELQGRLYPSTTEKLMSTNISLNSTCNPEKTGGLSADLYSCIRFSMGMWWCHWGIWAWFHSLRKIGCS